MPSAMTKQPTSKTNGKPGPKHNIDAVREAYYERISKFDMAPLWKVMKIVVTKEPVTRCVPVVWHYDDVKSLVMESGGLITAEEAQRRVLILENPAMRGESRATNTLFAGIQMILPGEVAPAHRHVSSAIRFVLDGEGAYTAVEGEKAFMSPGDFVITANWAPHDHGNPSKKPMLWLDVLDFPAVNFYEASFADYFDENDKMQNTTRQDGDSLPSTAPACCPTAPRSRLNRSPVINYTYARTRPILDRLKKSGEIDSATARACTTPIRSTAARCCRPWGPGSPCCRRASRARTTARPTAPSSSASKAAAPPRSSDQVLEWGAERHVRGAALEALCAPRGQGVGAVLDLRPSGAGGARHLASGQEPELASPTYQLARD